MAFFSRMKSLGFGKDKTNDPEPAVGDSSDSDADLLAVTKKAKSSNDHADSNSGDEWEEVTVYKPAPAPTVKVKKRSSGDRSGKSPHHLPTHKKNPSQQADNSNGEKNDTKINSTKRLIFCYTNSNCAPQEHQSLCTSTPGTG